MTAAAEAIAAARACICDDIDQSSLFVGTDNQEIYVFVVPTTEGRFTIHHYAQALWELCAQAVIDGYRIIACADSAHGNTYQPLPLDTNLVVIVRQRHPRPAGEGDGPSGRQGGDEPLG